MKYEYSSLSVHPEDPRGVFSIRLLHLLPATNRDARLECKLVESQIPSSIRGRSQLGGAARGDPADVPEFQALSYTWGVPEFPESLFVLGEDADDAAVDAPLAGVLGITENLHSALQSLRRPGATLVLWVDAICVDQANIPERNSQVANIPQTYTAAVSVLVWLGTDNLQRTGALCLSFFTDLAALIVGDSNDRKQDNKVSWRRRLKINQAVSAFLDSPGRPILSFLDRPWFRRRWIVQEVVLANDVSVHCGQASIPWQTFEVALTELFENDKGGFGVEHRKSMRTMSRIRNRDSGAKSQLPLDTLVEFENFLCANPRDRLYALYGVIQHWFPGSADKEAQTGNVDYALSVGDVFTNFAILMMKLNDTLPSEMDYNPVTHVLQLAAALKHDRDVKDPRLEERCGNIPSWVPDWTGTLASKPLNHSPTHRDASFGIPKRQIDTLAPSRDRHLIVSIGIVYDIVMATVPLNIEPLFGPIHEAKAALNEFLCKVADTFINTGFFGNNDVDVYRPTGQHIVIAVATALVANWEHTPTNSYFAQDYRFPVDFLEQLASSQYHLPEILHKWPAYIELIAITMRGRRLFLTQSGHLGICDADVQAGDVVSILSDTRIPFILRPRGEAAMGAQQDVPHIPGCYSFQNEAQLLEYISSLSSETSAHYTFQSMGDAYVHGLMDGEAAKALGPRLEHFLRILPIS